MFGVRHHGPGSARSVAVGLDQLRPDVVLIEGPPDFNRILPLAAASTMQPPIAALAYDPDEPRRGSFYPMASFSPEWVAMRWALANGARIGFADLGAGQMLSFEERDASHPPRDPIGTLAAAAGYSDSERWWEDAVEQRAGSDPIDRFGAVTEAMREFRSDDRLDDFTAVREAAMRKIVRATMKDRPDRVVIVCGAFHAPVLHPDDHPKIAADNVLLRGLDKCKVKVTWVPWSDRRLAASSGYGAGVSSPGWYHHLFTRRPDDVVTDWMVRAAQVLRTEQHQVSPAAVVEATRLVQTLGTLRGRPAPGLDEVNDATVAVLGGGSALPLALIHRELIVGTGMGRVPDETPMVPLVQDLVKTQKRLRLKRTAGETTVSIDLRRANQLARSQFFHRLGILDIDWAVQVNAGASLGTFKEAWITDWHPELEVAAIDASRYGNTVEVAAINRVSELAAGADTLADLSTLAERCLLSDLAGGLDAVVDALAKKTALEHDARILLEAVEPLARTMRYGDVRKIDTTMLRELLSTIVTRGSVGVGAACRSLDDEAASSMRSAIEGAHRGIAMLAEAALFEPWMTALARLAGEEGVHGLVVGRVNRLLLDRGRLERDEVGRRLGRVLSTAAEARRGASWLDGFLDGDAVLLLHDPKLLGIIDEWVTHIAPDVFDDVLPLLRRTFSRYADTERRDIGTRLRNGQPEPDDSEFEIDELALPAVAKAALLLGLGEVAR